MFCTYVEMRIHEEWEGTMIANEVLFRDSHPGRINSQWVQEGQRVVKGDLLFTIDNVPFYAPCPGYVKLTGEAFLLLGPDVKMTGPGIDKFYSVRYDRRIHAL